MKADAAIAEPARFAPDDLDDWLLTLDEFAPEEDLDGDEDLRFAYDDPARRPLD